MGQESDHKTQLVLEICSISTRSLGCVHTLLSNPSKPPFIDWYCILGVEENAGLVTIRQQYHKLALQLHPDKNKHPKAEIAFKLISEAYMCLSDAAKRKGFDSKRSKNFCFECNRIPYTSKKVPFPGNSNGSTRSYKVRRNIKEMREMLKEEAKVIEKCLRANLMSKKESPLYNPADYRHGSRFLHNVEREVPVFNPMKYLYQGYPHLRDHVHHNSETCWCFDTRNLVQNHKREAKYGSPVFEVRSQNKFPYQPS